MMEYSLHDGVFTVITHHKPLFVLYSWHWTSNSMSSQLNTFLDLKILSMYCLGSQWTNGMDKLQMAINNSLLTLSLLTLLLKQLLCMSF